MILLSTSNLLFNFELSCDLNVGQGPTLSFHAISKRETLDIQAEFSISRRSAPAAEPFALIIIAFKV
jgi:hypothetical protein